MLWKGMQTTASNGFERCSKRLLSVCIPVGPIWWAVAVAGQYNVWLFHTGATFGTWRLFEVKLADISGNSVVFCLPWRWRPILIKCGQWEIVSFLSFMLFEVTVLCLLMILVEVAASFELVIISVIREQDQDFAVMSADAFMNVLGYSVQDFVGFLQYFYRSATEGNNGVTSCLCITFLIWCYSSDLVLAVLLWINMTLC